MLQQFQTVLETRPTGLEAVSLRMASEVHRICEISDRIQRSGNVQTWQHSLSQHRIDKCLHYYRLGSTRGRVELHSSLSAIVYRYIAPAKSQLGFNGRYALLEDFLQNYYIEALNAFRREHGLAADYTPRSRLELAEYMAFCEQYAKRRITLRGRQSQQLLVLRAQSFARRLPAETAVDMALAADSGRSDEGDLHARSAPLQQVRQQMVSEMDDPADAVIRERVVNALITYLEEQDQQDCVDYLVLKLQDCSASEIDVILNLSARERDYLQQRFKYHVEKFARVHEWELVHQWLEANLEERFGMTEEEWQEFSTQLTSAQQRLIALKREHQSLEVEQAESEIAAVLGWTPKKVQRVWSQILGSAAKFRNQGSRPATKNPLSAE
ncbi:hypothetical protein C7271_01630 [filamentous cyanobacterium CCP5]|nr:hypothetical protein C7271_01630 [filamentous cyanobacterium CCP5]